MARLGARYQSAMGLATDNASTPKCHGHKCVRDGPTFLRAREVPQTRKQCGASVPVSEAKPRSYRSRELSWFVVAFLAMVVGSNPYLARFVMDESQTCTRNQLVCRLLPEDIARQKSEVLLECCGKMAQAGVSCCHGGFGNIEAASFEKGAGLFHT